jgi:hypothetical protein
LFAVPILAIAWLTARWLPAYAHPGMDTVRPPAAVGGRDGR